MLKCSVVMSVYNKENPKFLRASLESVFSQSATPNEVVLVCDGSLNEKLDKTIESFQTQYSHIFRVIRSPEKLGTAGAANLGIKSAKYDIIIKTDSDDINLPNRIEKQLKAFEADPELEICSAHIREFESETKKEIAIKKVPLCHKEILKYAKRRNPFNNPVLAYKRKKALEIGGYEPLERCEDYDFVVRMLMSGARGQNIDEVLLDYRVSSDNLQRRRNWRNTKSFIAVRFGFFKKKFCSFSDFLIPSAAQLLLFLLPVGFTDFVYKKLLRR